jgi:hypothetical protein
MQFRPAESAFLPQGPKELSLAAIDHELNITANTKPPKQIRGTAVELDEMGELS